MPTRSTLRCAASAAVLALVLVAPASGQSRPLALEDVLDLLQFADRQPVDLSPDGQLVAAALVRPSREADQREPYVDYFSRSGASLQTLGASVWLADVRTGESRNLTGDDGTAWGPAWSPDGRLLAFYSDRDGLARLWVWDRGQDELRRVADAIVRPDFGFETPRWSPDGRRILLKLLPEGMTVQDAARLLPGRGPQEMKAADSDRAAVTVLAGDPALLPASAPVAGSAGGGGGTSWTNKYLSDLGVVDVASGRVTRIARRVKPLAFAFSPDGRRVFHTDMRWHEEGGGRGLPVYSLVVIDLASGERRVFEDVLREYGINVSWGPDGRRIAYIDAAGGVVVLGGESPDAPLRSWRERVRLERAGVDFTTDYRPPLWSRDGRRIYLLARDTLWEASVDGGRVRPVGAVPGHQLRGVVADVENGRMWAGPDGASAYVVTRDRRTRRMGFHRIPLAGGAGELLWQADAYIGPSLPYLLDVERGAVAFVSQDARHPQDVWLATDGLRNARQLTHLHPGLDRFTLGESRLIEWQSATGEALQGVLLLPPDHSPGKRYPLIVHVYPNARPSYSLNYFGLDGTGPYNQQLLATRGYAVLFPDAPFPPGKPVDGLAAAVLPAIDRVIELGIADPERIGVTGYSWGGYATMALLTRSSRFAAAIAEQGFASLFGDYFQLRPDGTAVGVNRVEGYGDGMGGHPWEEGRLEGYIAQSPLFQLDRVDAPVLLIHGDADGTVPPHLSGEIFVGLRRLGKPVVFALYEGEDHGVGGWSRRNLEDYVRRVWAWWDRWLVPGRE